MTPRIRRHCAVGLLAMLLPLAGYAQASQEMATPVAETSGYQLPVSALQAIVDAPRAPQLVLGPKRDIAAMVVTPALAGIDVVAQPELKLAGLRINPRAYASSQFAFGTALWLMDVASGTTMQVDGLPAPLAVASVEWSPDQASLAFNHVDTRSGANELWLVDINTRRAQRLVAKLNTVAGRGYTWMPDSKQLLVQVQPEGQGAAPVVSNIPTGPSIQQTDAGAGVRQLRTYQDLLKNEGDAQVFAHYLRSQLALVDMQGQMRSLAAPGLYLGASPSPDGQHLLVQEVQRPFSYQVPVSSFPREIAVLDMQGKRLHTLAQLPLVEGLPPGNDAVPLGPRRVSWRSDAPATLVWAEAQDGGDPNRDVQVRDAVLMHAAPFKGKPVVLAKLASRFSGIAWARGDLALLNEFWWKTRQQKQWRVYPGKPTTAPVLIHEGSREDRYNNPGAPVTVRDANGFERLQIAGDGNSIFLLGAGASPEGDRPFVDRLNLQSKHKQRLFHSQAPYYEAPIALLDDDASRLLMTRESPTEPTNIYLQSLTETARQTPVALTAFPHPTPQLRDVQKEQIRYTRHDGVELTGNLYLPPGYDVKRDGALPVLMWAYPAEFKSAAAASQVTGSPYRFNAISYWGPLPFLARGYAVLDNPSMPIVGEGSAEPNDTYVPQLVANAEAAVNELVRRGVGDRARMAVGGHSYGAFMTANLLAHSRLFKAGIARSGAYNRTLTPFGFQSEERNYWQARDVYHEMSPFTYAENIKDALLMIHGEEDNNSGTFPIQSERMFAAVKGMGGTARLVMLPNESHGYRARESILHMLAETDAWLEKYVKQPAAK